MDPLSWIGLLPIIGIALAFDFLNGQHDAGNAVACSIATRAMPWKGAILLSACCNFLAFFVFGLHVAGTIGKGLVDPHAITSGVVLAALLGACCWNVITLRAGIPSSSSHALVGGLIGAMLVHAGWGAVHWHTVGIIVLAIVGSPLVGLGMSMAVMALLTWSLRRANPYRANRGLKRLQVVSCACLSLAHGGNDAQKTMGIIAVLLFSQGRLGPTFYVPFWVVVLCQLAMTLGTLCGGKAIISTMGSRITALRPLQGAASDFGGACALSMATWLGIPVSSTHTITGGIVGVGTARTISAVRWNTTRRIVVAWFLTLPAAALVGAGVYSVISLL